MVEENFPEIVFQANLKGGFKIFSGGGPPDPPIFFWLASLAIEVDLVKIFSGSAPAAVNISFGKQES